MSKLFHRVFASLAVLIIFLFGGAGSLRAQSCSTTGNVTTCTPAIGQLIYNDTSGQYNPYPSDITGVTGVGGPVSTVTVTLTNVTANLGRHIWAMLVGPNGNNIVFFGRPCNGTSGNRNIPGTTFTIDDNGGQTFPGAGAGSSPNCDALPASTSLQSSFYKPFADNVSASNIVFPAPAPAPTFATPSGTATFSGQFSGMSAATANGTWTLYVAGVGTNIGDTGSVGANASSPAWTLNIAWTNATATSTTVSSNLNPSFTSGASSLVTLTASVTSTSTVNGGTVTFKDGATTIACSGGNQTVASGSATCQFTFPTEGAHIITAQYGGSGSFAGSNSAAITQVVNNHTTNPVGQEFCNTGQITIPQTGSNGNASGTPASPYASEIFVSGQNGTIQDLQVHLNGFTSTEPFAEGFLLVSPTGKTLDFLSQAGGGVPFSNFNFIIADSGATQMPDASAPSNNTTYKPSSYTNAATTYCQSAVCNGVTVSEPAPNAFDSAAPRGSKTMLGEFGGLSANGTWQLFVVDRQPGQTASLSGGWCLNFTLAVGAHPTTTTLGSSLNPSFLGDSVTFTATVVNQDTPSGQINEGTVTFVDGLTNLGSGNVTFNGTANVATFTTSDPLVLNERTHQISATYNGTANFAFSSSNTVQQVVNRHSTLTINSPTYSYCNLGPVTVPAAGASNALQGVARPYPSNIFVARLPGVTNKATLSLNNFTSNLPSDFGSLLVGPGGGPTFAFDFFSRVGGTNCVGDPNCPGGTGFNGPSLTFQDGSGAVPTLSSNQGAITVEMNSGPGTNTWPAPAPASFQYATPQGSALLSAFNNQNNIGTWALYMENLVNGAFGGIGDNVNPSNPSLNAWCVNLRQTLPDISLTATPMTHSPTVFTRGQAASFTITATNLGPGPTGDPTLTITDTLPAGLTFTGFTGTGWNCSAVGQLVTCTNPNPIALNASSSFTINVTVGTGNTTADTISNSATITLGTGGDDPATTGNDTTSSGTITVAGTILTINKIHTDPFTQGQVGAQYHITVKNTGADGTSTPGHAGATVGTITVTDALPTNFTLTAVSGTGWTCQPPASGVMCTLNAALAVGSTTSPIDVTVTVSNTMLGPVTNTAMLTATTDQIGNANTHDDITNITQVPTQMLANANTTPQSAPVNTAFGTLLGVTVEDAGNHPVAGVSVTFAPPGAGASGTFAVASGCTAASCVISTNASGVATASTFTANSTAGGPYNVHASSGALAATVDFSLTNVAPPSISKQFGASTIQPGTTTTLTVTLTNPAANTVGLTGVGFNDTFPGGLSVASLASNTCTGTLTGGTTGSTSLSLSGASLATSASCSVVVNVTSSTAGAVTNNATASSTNGGNNPTPATATLNVVGPPNISKLFGASSIPSGGTTTLTITIANPPANTVGLTGVGFADTFPAGLSVASAASNNCSGTLTGATAGATSLSLSGASLGTPSGTCSVVVNVTSATPGSITNSATASSTNGGNNPTAATAGLAIVAPPNISKQFGVSNLPSGTTTTMTITLTNPAGNTVGLTGVGFADTFPTGLSVASAGSNTCGGTLTGATAGSTSLNLSAASLATSASCSVTVNVTSSTPGSITNSATASSTNGGNNPTAATAGLTVGAPPSISKQFGVSSIQAGGTTSLTITLTNPAANTVALTGVGFNDTFPGGLSVASLVSNTCTGTLTGATAGSTTLSLSGASLTAPSGTCSVVANVTSSTAGTVTNSATASSTNGGNNPTAATATLNVVGPPNISKLFGASSIPSGGTTTLTITITNPAANTVGLTGVGFADSFPAGLSVASAVSNNCSGTLTGATAGATSLSLSGASLGTPSGTCSVVVNVTSATAGSITNSATASSTNGGNNPTAASASLAIVAPPNISKQFGASNLSPGATTTMTITLTNPAGNTVGLTGVGFADTFPAGLAVANTVGLSNTCGGTLTGATAGSTSLSLSAASLATSASCSVTVNVTSSTSGPITNSATASSTNGGNNPTPATASLTVVMPPSISKQFGASSIPSGGTTTLTIGISNPAGNTVALTGVGFNDTFPPGLSVTSAVSNTCNGTLTGATAGSTSLSLSGASLALPPASCSVVVNVTSSTAGPITNSATASSTNGGNNPTPATAPLNVVGPPNISKQFGASSIPSGTTTTLTITLTNPAANSVGLTGVGFADSFPVGVTVAATVGLNNTCGGTLTGATAGSQSLNLSGASLTAPSGSCSVTVNVTSSTVGAYINSATASSTNGGNNPTAATATLAIVAPPNIAKQFAASNISPGGITTMTITLTNPAANPVGLTGVGFTDNFPTGLSVAPVPNLTNNCGGTITGGAAGTTSLSLSGGALGTSASCKVMVDVTSSTSGSVTNSATASSTNGGNNPTPATASLSTVSPPSISKQFGASSIPSGGTTTLTLSLTNPASNTVALTGVGFADTFPAGLSVAATVGLNNTCNGTLTGATAGSTSLSLSGASLAVPPASCTVTLNVTSSTAGAVTNSATASSTNGGNNPTPATAGLTVVVPPSISKQFGASSIPSGGATTLTISLSNPGGNTVGLTGVGFADSFPAGLSVTSLAGNTCSGGTLTGATAGSTSLSLSAASLGTPSGTCVVTVNVTSSTPGSITNSATASSANGGNNPTAATASLAIVAPPNISKQFGASNISPGGTTTLKITLTNPAANTVGLTGVGFTDNFPGGLSVAATVGLNNTCNGTLTGATAGSTSLSLNGASLAVPPASCSVTVNVTSSTSGPITNSATASSTNGGNNPTPATAGLSVVAPPTISKAFKDAQIPFNTDTTLTFTITNPAANPSGLTGVAFTDTLPLGLPVSSTPNVSNTCGGTLTISPNTAVSLSGGTLAPNGNCTISVNVTGASTGVKNNSVTVTSNESGTNARPGTASVTVVAANVSGQVKVTQSGFGRNRATGIWSATMTITNTSASPITGPVQVVLTNLTSGVTMTNKTGTFTGSPYDGSPYITVSVGPLAAGAAVSVSIQFTNPSNGFINYTPVTFSGGLPPTGP